MSDELREAYARGLHDGEVRTISESVANAHLRIDKHDSRLTALERVMYAGMGVIFLIELVPNLTRMAGAG